ncbi:methyltransferase [Mesorhizobium sp. M4A.F.Ca.ET.050.02.1.1]|uniref:trimethylamine methyltransferase family protein n=1 Tax=Mesorhizobium sp. M4A.F.Ca.ET.050.02.1.1 TaxID=2496754 RepID=UPI000FCC6E5F|nr:trimethylamine methyltransferase family protein [Mesorhizobium sp. M4A.F.Ca.ET.050.02.1.1]RUX47512.1 methyltransferase [Mesorhizobium sp. M4A.F.Ca.ET.050.02.1.1]
MTRKSGGRAARLLGQAYQDRETTGPVRPGLLGGSYKPLLEDQIQLIHKSSLDVLEHIGMADATEEWRDVIVANGGWTRHDNRLCFPPRLVEEALTRAARNFKLFARDPKHDLDISGTRVHFAGCSGTVYVLDIGSRSFRESQLIDLYDQVRLEDALENIHYVQRPCIARDMVDPFDLDINTAYACMAGTTKHIAMSVSAAAHIDKVVQLLDISLGGSGDGSLFRRRPFVQALVSAAVPPLRFPQDSCRIIDAAVRTGMPVLVFSAGQAGATAPATLLGALVQANAEVLASLAYVNLIAPGYPVLVGHNTLVSDLRTGACAGGCAEASLLAAAGAQLCQFYGLPSNIMAGATSSKQPDGQAGWEKGYQTTMAALSGGNMITQTAGHLADYMMSSFEALTLDNDMLGAVLRAVRGIDVTEERLSFREIQSVVDGGQGHYLGESQTLDLMRSEYYYPAVGNRQSLKDWHESGAKDMRDRSIERTLTNLRTHFPDHLEPSIDRRIREEFNIFLSPESMRADTSRWSQHPANCGTGAEETAGISMASRN